MPRGVNYAAAVKAALLDQNRQKVLRRKEEVKFVQSLEKNFQLSHLETIRAELVGRSVSATAVAERQFPSRPRTPSPEAAESVECVHFLECEIRCLVCAQGGATLWTGEADGSIGIRNGVTGALRYRIQPASDVAVVVDTLSLVGNNVVAGYSDGAIRVYDQLVFVLAFEAHEHTSSVTAIAATFDQRWCSASIDGSLVKWDSEANGFLLMARAVVGEPIHAVAAYGYHVFCGLATGDIVGLDLDTLAPTVRYVGHRGRVRGVVVQDGYLFSAGEDGTTFCWTVGAGEPLQALERPSESSGAPFASLHADIMGHALWAVDVRGSVYTWSTKDDDDFAFLRASAGTAHTGETQGICGLAALDSVKMWALGANGVNRVYHATHNRMEDGYRYTLRAMKGIVDQDEIELTKWDRLTKALRDVGARVSDHARIALACRAHQQLRMRLFSTWLRFVEVRRARRQQNRLSDVLANQQAESQRRECFQRWVAFRNAKVQRGRAQALSTWMRHLHDQRLLTVYSKKFQDWCHVQHRHSRATRACGFLTHCMTVSCMRDAFDRLLRFRRWKRLQHKQRELAAALGAVALSAHVSQCWAHWMLSAMQRRQRRTQLGCASATCAKHEQATMGQAWARWIAAVRQKRSIAIRAAVPLPLLAHTSRLVVRRGFRLWGEWVLDRQRKATVLQRSTNAARVSDLKESVASIEHLLQRRKLLDEADELVRTMVEQKTTKEAIRNRLADEAQKLQAALEAKRSDQDRRGNSPPSVAAQLADLLALLKCKLFNFSTDVAALQRISEKCHRAGPAKVFLEAHQAVKRVVVELTNNGYLAIDEEWPLTDTVIRKMKRHHVEVILGAIKTMIVTYDALDVAQRAALTSDTEIVVNAHHLTAFAERCVAIKKRKTRGRM